MPSTPSTVKERIKKRLPGLFKVAKRAYYRTSRINPFISSRYMYTGKGKYFDLKQRRVEEIRPNMFIIGAEKSGTTSLHNYLDQHPEIFMAKPNKEAQYLLDFTKAKIYYDRPDMPVRNRNDILKNHILRGYQGEKIIGESSTSYTRGRSAIKFGVLERLKSYLPQPKLIYIVRHPLERIISNYLHKVRERGIDETLEFEINDRRSYLQTGLYGYQLSNYLEIVPRENIMLIFYENFINDGKETLKRIVNFLEVEGFDFDLGEVHNVGKNKKDFSPEELKFTKKDYKRLMKKIEPDIKLLEKLTGKKVPWTFEEKDWVKSK